MRNNNNNNSNNSNNNNINNHNNNSSNNNSNNSNNNGNNNNLIVGPLRFNYDDEATFGEGFFPQFLGGVKSEPYYRLLPYPIPAIPPYFVRTQHIRGIRTTDDTNLFVRMNAYYVARGEPGTP